jgi:hypothetical protein
VPRIRPPYPPEFRREAIELVRISSKSQRQIAEDLGILDVTLRNWVKQAERDQGKRAFVLFTDTHLRYLLPARLRDDPRLGVFGELSDSHLLTEPEPGRTRVVRRMRMTCGPRAFRALAVPIVLIWGEQITARDFLRGVKRRTERTS